jgi:hypothetical protein
MAASLDSFPGGAWTMYFHDPNDSMWTADSYKQIGTFRNFADLWATLNRIGTAKLLAGMFFVMRDPYPPLWENRANINGGSYCIKVPEKSAAETFQRYVAAGILNLVQQNTSNQIVGISISPKKGFHILKIWNTDYKHFHKATDIQILGDGMIGTDIIYRPHVDQKM